MSYATLEDLIERAGPDEIGQIADRDRDGVADDAVIEAALATADQTIDAYLGSRYRLPLDPAPAIVRKWAVSIARYQLHRDGAPEHVARDERSAMTELRDAGTGKIALPGASGNEPERGGSDRVVSESSPAAFDDRAFEGWR